MNTLIKILLTAVAVLILAYILPGIHVASFTTAIIVAVVLGLLRVTVKPLLILFTLPATILSLGLFLFVINAAIILLADYFVSGFTVDGFWIALLFSILLSVLQSVLFSVLEKDKES